MVIYSEDLLKSSLPTDCSVADDTSLNNQEFQITLCWKRSGGKLGSQCGSSYAELLGQIVQGSPEACPSWIQMYLCMSD